jgi:hypothetical protein
MSPISKDYLGEVIATAYLLFLGLLFSGLVAVFAPRDVSPLGLFQVGFALYFVAIATVNKTTFDLSALAGKIPVELFGRNIAVGWHDFASSRKHVLGALFPALMPARHPGAAFGAAGFPLLGLAGNRRRCGTPQERADRYPDESECKVF